MKTEIFPLIFKYSNSRGFFFLKGWDLLHMDMVKCIISVHQILHWNTSYPKYPFSFTEGGTNNLPTKMAATSRESECYDVTWNYYHNYVLSISISGIITIVMKYKKKQKKKNKEIWYKTRLYLFNYCQINIIWWRHNRILFYYKHEF